MSIPIVRKNDTGTAFRISVTENDEPIDLTSATAVTVLLRSPWGNFSQHSATIATVDDATVIQYTTAAGDLNASGIWRIQGNFTLSGWTGTTSENEFKVEEIYE